MSRPPYCTIYVVDRTAQLIVERFKVLPDYAKRLALGVLDGIESHGGDSTDWETIANAVEVVVAGWVKNGTDFPKTP